EREYVFGHRDRMDERYDIIRMVRDKRYKYLRNYEPFKPYHQYMNTPEKGAEMQEFHRLADQGQLPPDAQWFTREEKPVEELYDCQSDTHEINNLAADPQYRDILVRMRKVHEQWMIETKDLGLIPEPELVAIEKEYGTRYAFFRQLDRDNGQLLRELRSVASLAGKPEIADLPALLEALDHPEPSFRYWGLTGIGNLGMEAESALEKVYHGLSDRSPVVRVAAARALYRMGHEGQEALPVLVDELQSPYEWVRLKAATVLDSIGERARPAIPVLKAALKDTYNKYVVRVANRALNQMLGTKNQVR
ncbi:MAG TPA: HEAT repeat domain-containing protein, partial [bacterium]|nr:HEAT repeat domain-containing protein [bacterium]